MHYKRKRLILKSRPLLLIYCSLTHNDVTGWTDYVNMASHR